MNRRLRLLLVGAVVFLLIAALAGVLAAVQAQRADREASVARARELAASAITVLDEDPGLSKLLAVAATSIDDPPIETITALHAALATDPVVYRYSWPADRAVSTEIVTDLSRSGRNLVATGYWFRGTHDYLEVVDRTTDERLWSVVSEDAAVGIGYGFFSPDGARVVFGGYREEAPPEADDPSRALVGVHIRDTATGAVLQNWDVGPCGAVVVAASARNALIRTSTGESCIVPSLEPSADPVGMEVLDLATGERTMLTPDAPPNSDLGALSRDGRWAAFADRSAGPFLVDLRTSVRTPIGFEHDFVWDVSDDGTLVALGDAPVQVWDARTGRTTPLGEAADTGGVSYAEFGLDGRSIFTTQGDSLVRRWDALTGTETGSWPGATGGRPAVSTEGLLLVGHWGTPTAALIDTRVRGELGAAETRKLTHPSPEIEHCKSDRVTGSDRLHERGGRAVFTEYCFGLDGNIPIAWSTFVYDVGTLEVRAFHGVAQAALSPDGRRLAAVEAHVDGDRMVVGPTRIIDLDTDASITLDGMCSWTIGAGGGDDDCREFPERPFALEAVRINWSPDGTMLAIVGAAPPGYFAVWDTATGGLVSQALDAVPVGRHVRTFDVSFTPDSSHLVAVVLDDEPFGKLLRISTTTWQVEDRRELVDAEYQLAIVGSTPDGSGFLGISRFQRSGEALHWIDTETLQPLREPRGRLHEGLVYAAAMSPDGSLIATGSADGSLRVRDVTTGQVVDELAFPGQSVNGVTFVGPREIAVLLADQGNLVLLTLDEPRLVAIARASLTRGFSPAECERFGFDDCPTLEAIRAGWTAR